MTVLVLACLSLHSRAQVTTLNFANYNLSQFSRSAIRNFKKGLRGAQMHDKLCHWEKSANYVVTGVVQTVLIILAL